MDLYEKLKLEISELETLNETQANLITEMSAMMDKLTEENLDLKEKQNEKAINELERAKANIEGLYAQYRGDVSYVDIVDTINPQIKELKGG